MDGSETGHAATSESARGDREGAVIVSTKLWPWRKPLFMLPVKVLVSTAPARLEMRCAVTVLLCPLLQWMVQLTVAVDSSCRHERLVVLDEVWVPPVTPAASPVPTQGP